LNDLLHRYRSIRNFNLILLIGLFLFANLAVMIIVYSYVSLIMIFKTLMSTFKKRIKVSMIIFYGFILAIQVVYASVAVFPLHNVNLMYYPAKMFAVILLSLPFFVERFVTNSDHQEFSLPTAGEAATISFEELRDNSSEIKSMMQGMARVKENVSVDNIKTVLEDIPRHSAIRYINHGSLTEDYFKKAEASLVDEHLYLVVSNTGSPASEIISTFTQKQYNHISLSFDRDLDTIISYNGGNNVYPPGMNAEVVEYFHQKEDASVLVYSLPVTVKQKQFILDEIIEINQEGSAYNMVGLVAKHSYKPNIMFCSQFVYKMLEMADLTFFDKKPGEVRPTDFIELDYYKKLKFEYEIRF